MTNTNLCPKCKSPNYSTQDGTKQVICLECLTWRPALQPQVAVNNRIRNKSNEKD